MNDKNFTPEQLQAIDKNRKSLLVSAAAGSGKTTVLVERVCQILADSENPVSPGEMLIVTFTNAAAAEMKERISRTLKECAKKSGNGYIKKQQMLLPQCNISTIDSFCQQLVRDNFYLTDVDYDFKFVSNADRMELSDTAIKDTVEYIYKTYGNDGANFFKAMRGIDSASAEIEKLYNHVYALPFPEDFFISAKEKYETDENGNNYYVDRARDDLKEKTRFSINKIKGQVEIFIDATKHYMETLLALKKEKNIYDFSDIEHIAMNLLCKKEDGKDVITEKGLSLAKKFKHVLVDEYQDTNELQDKIFRILSNNGENLFIVGDSKQSIYGFRQANPEIFINLKKENTKNVINLSANFRSQKKICDLVNSVFSTFDEDVTGGINYAEENLIPKAKYPEDENENPEFWLVDIRGGKDNGAVNEANLISQWINEKISEEYEIFDLRLGAKRPLQYKDIAILLRSTKTHGAEYKEILNKNGIPAFFFGDDNAFLGLEVRIILDLLRAINNPLNDVYLFSALLSPFFGFTPDDVVTIRKKGKNLYSSLIMSAKEGFSQAESALKIFEDLKEKSVNMPIYLFIEDLYLSMGYYAVVGGMPEGEIKQRNLKKLVAAAENYSENSNGTLRGFIKYVENLQKKSDGAGQTSNEDNMVKIMSGHKSKGLEYPVCFIAGMGSGGSNNKEASVINTKSGIGINYYDEDTDTRYKNEPFEIIDDDNSKESFAEELRILYVELTRAKNKMIAIYSGDKRTNLEKKIGELDDLVDEYKAKELKIDFKTMSSSLKTIGKLFYVACKLSGANIEIKRKVPIETNRVSVTVEEEPDMEMVEKLRKRFSIREEKENIPAKITASELNRQNHGEDYNFETKPSFLLNKGLTSTQKGTAMHNFMQYCNFDNAIDNFSDEAERLVTAGFISEEAKEVIDENKVREFFESPLYDRIKSSKEIYREKQFTVLIKADEIFKDAKSDEKTVVQGICDLAFIEDGKLTIIDYKTDKCNNAKELFERYKEQLNLYAKCLDKALGVDVGKIGIYSFSKSDCYEEAI